MYEGTSPNVSARTGISLGKRHGREQRYAQYAVRRFQMLQDIITNCLCNCAPSILSLLLLSSLLLVGGFCFLEAGRLVHRKIKECKYRNRPNSSDRELASQLSCFRHPVLHVWATWGLDQKRGSWPWAM
jgi:hypothetical protein